MKTNQSRRGKVYLGWKLHGRLVARLAVLWFTYHLVLWGALCALDFLPRLPASLGPQQAIVATQAAQIPVLESFLRQHGWMAFFEVLIFPIMICDVIRLTNRVVGPLRRLENTLNRMSAGETVTHVTFRDGDLLEGVEKSLNNYLATLHPKTVVCADAKRSHMEAAPPLMAQSCESSDGRVERGQDNDCSHLLSQVQDIDSIVAATGIRPGHGSSVIKTPWR